MKDISPILRSLGMVDSEISTYLAALENGPGTAIDLTKATKLSRQATYVAIETLTKRGLMSSYLSGKKRFYSAEHPERLLAYARRREVKLKDYIRELERALPELELKTGGERPVIRLYEGRGGVRSLIEEVLTKKPKIVKEIADVAAVRAAIAPEDLQPLRDALKKTGTKTYALYSGEPLEKVTGGIRYLLPAEFQGFKADIAIYEDRIALFTLEGKMYSILIESAALARAMNILFDLALKGARDYPTRE